jgi:hypothetical protein
MNNEEISARKLIGECSRFHERGNNYPSAPEIIVHRPFGHDKCHGFYYKKDVMVENLGNVDVHEKPNRDT